ncbi:ABC transporter permease [Arthrobacter sp. MYb229]|uniref:ABC transporter permease n=1 Tax=unclassified Arthrobacter TaxID=235627 RepID=UPI000CFACAC1|nr:MULTISPECIES: ABC transporter permease [unclassified Arthrobacter]PRA04410.1 ABC transporter permease [Arthrobacter sp. MYb229]PRB51676.1 ABC transporter permease [Arthrobacter sp. MYb216]
MLTYLPKRIGQGLLTVFMTISVVFLLIRMAPGDPAAAFAGPLATTEQLAAVREQFGLEAPVFQQYLIFIGQLFTGNLGTSYSFQAPAMQVVLERLPYTLTLATSSIVLAALVSIPLGMWMARRADTGSELGVNVVTVAGQSMPDFWTGIMLLTGFSVLLPIFPASGFTTWGGLFLPTLTVAILQIALVSRMVRREMVNNFNSPYLTVARSRGVSERALTWRYALGNAGIPVFTALGTRFAAMLNGVVVVEVVFGWPGVGSLIVRALETRDYPLIQATVLITALLAVAVQLLIDLAYPLFDPRVRLGKAASV